MFAGWQLILVALSYLMLLFGIAWWGDRRALGRNSQKPRPFVYSLALAIYCTSWTFFGAVGQAAEGGWVYLGIFLGPILAYVLGWRLIRKTLRASKAQNITSIADFIASRYGKWQVLAVVVTLVALIGSLPYIALQLKAVAMAYDMLIHYPAPPPDHKQLPAVADTAFHVAIVMAIFAILFGTRSINATEHHNGLVKAIAFEGVVKLLAFLAVGSFITYGVFSGFNDLMSKAQIYFDLQKTLGSGDVPRGLIAQTLVSMFAILMLPRQFHVTVVENTHQDDLKVSRWLLPLYLVLIALFVMPIAAAGLILFSDGSVEPDVFMLALPLSLHSKELALVAFFGGFSAATSMSIMATVAISIMVSNEIVIPFLLKSRWNNNTSHHDFGRVVLRIRRLTMLAVMLLSYLTYRLVAEFNSLAATGLLSFAAIAQLAPAVIGGLIWKRGNRWGALAGLVMGMWFWAYTLLIPSLQAAGLIDARLMSHGPWDIQWLRPDALLGTGHLDFFTHGVFWSLGVNLLAYISISRLTRQRVIDRIQASAFVDNIEARPAKIRRPWQGVTTVGDLKLLGQRFIGHDATNQAFDHYAHQRHLPPLRPEEKASIELIQFTERLLAGVLGASSARIVISSTLQGKEIQIADVISIVDEASQVLEFSRGLLQSTVEHLSQGISVVDQHQRLVVWNQRYLELFHFPDGFVQVGCPMVDVFRYNAENGEYGPGDPEAHVQQLMDNIRQGEPHRYTRYRQDGTVLDVQGNPMPGGGFVFSYQDITQQKQTEEALIQSENNIRIYTDNVPALIAYFDTEKRYLFTNRAYEEAMGIDRTEVIGQPIYKVLSEAQYEHRRPYMKAALEGKLQSFELELPSRNKGMRYALVTYTPHHAENGDVLGFFGLYQDITERRLVEIALQETNEHLEERVRERTLALSELNAALLTENQVRAKAEDAMRQAKQQAEDANASKTRFLAAASHDLLQPLNAARLFTSALAQRTHDDNTRTTTENIDNSLKAAEELLSTLLDISKLDAGAMQPRISHFALTDILHPLKAEFSIMASQRDLELDVIDSRSWVKSDPQMLRRIVQNFLSNAMRYTREGRVLLGCRREGAHHLRIEVWDTGPGIPEAKQLEIFQEFRRLDTPDKHNEKGLGLGLSIAERMSRVMGHDLRVRSWPGQGTVFSITVEKGEVQQAPQVPASPRARINKLDGVTVLCIDNEPMILEGMSAMLSGWHCEVFTATTIGGAKSILRSQPEPPQVFLADYHLDNEVTGIMALKALEETLGEPVPGIVITADRTDEIAEEVQQAGYQLLHKPVKPAALRALMTRTLQRNRP